MKKQMLIIKCRDCGQELNRTVPLEQHMIVLCKVTSGMAAGPCPKGCRSTLTDLNLNTTVETVDTPEEFV